MKRRRFKIELTERQQLFLALLLVIMVAVSMLYCLGFASLTLRRSLENEAEPWRQPTATEEGSDLRPFSVFTRIADAGPREPAWETAHELAPSWESGAGRFDRRALGRYNRRVRIPVVLSREEGGVR